MASRLIKRVTWTLIVFPLLAAPADAAKGVATVFAHPAAGPSGTRVGLTGSRFGRNASVKLSVAGRRSVSVRTGARGGFRHGVTIPATAAKRVKLVARRGKRRVVVYFYVGPRAGGSEAGTARGARVRWSPRLGVAGTTVRVHGIALRRRSRMTASFAPAKVQRFETGPRGGFTRRIAVPQTKTGAHSVTLTGGRLPRLRLPYRVLPDPTVAAAGDIACGANSGSAQCEQMTTSDMLLQLAPNAVLALGDVQYEKGELSNFMSFYAPSWGRLKSITHPVVGNHEYGTSSKNGCGYACGYFDYFNGRGRLFGRAGERGKGYYAFDLGAWRLYATNSNCSRTGAPGCGPGSSQLRWLQADLKAHPRTCSLMYMHHPLFTSDTRDFDSPEGRANLRPLWQAFHAHGGDVVLTGHTHFYERYAPQDPNEHRDPARGIRQFIVGTGGRNVYSAGDVEPTSEVIGEKTFGVLRLGLHAAGYSWRFVPAPGETFTDAGSTACHR